MNLVTPVRIAAVHSCAARDGPYNSERMFESPPNAFSFRTDPWSSDYGSAVEMGEADETTRPM